MFHGIIPKEYIYLKFCDDLWNCSPFNYEIYFQWCLWMLVIFLRNGWPDGTVQAKLTWDYCQIHWHASRKIWCLNTPQYGSSKLMTIFHGFLCHYFRIWPLLFHGIYRSRINWWKSWQTMNEVSENVVMTTSKYFIWIIIMIIWFLLDKL